MKMLIKYKMYYALKQSLVLAFLQDKATQQFHFYPFLFTVNMTLRNIKNRKPNDFKECHHRALNSSVLVL